MKKTVSLKSDREFKRLYKKGGCVVSDCLVVYYKKNNLACNRLGLTASKKIGNAVTRNRVRRLIRESYRLREDRIKAGYDMVFVARKKMAEIPFMKVASAMDFLLRGAGLFEKDKLSRELV